MNQNKENIPQVMISMSIDQLTKYEQGIRALLRMVEVENCDPELVENIKAVYDLLNHLRQNHKLLTVDKIIA